MPLWIKDIQGSKYWRIPNTPPLPSGGGEILANVIWGEKYEKAKRKRGEMFKKKGERGKK